MWHWLLHALGVDNVSGHAYAWWSGAGSDIGELAIIGAVIGTWRRVNCHVKGCFRVARYPIAGGQYKVCGKHHPDHKVRSGQMTAEVLHRAHRDHYN